MPRNNPDFHNSRLSLEDHYSLFPDDKPSFKKANKRINKAMDIARLENSAKKAVGKRFNKIGKAKKAMRMASKKDA